MTKEPTIKDVNKWVLFKVFAKMYIRNPFAAMILLYCMIRYEIHKGQKP